MGARKYTIEIPSLGIVNIKCVGENPKEVLRDFLDNKGYIIKSIINGNSSYHNVKVTSETRNNYYYVNIEKKREKSEIYRQKKQQEQKKKEKIAYLVKQQMNQATGQIVYHGSDGGLKGEIDCTYNKSSKGKESILDFGVGFYTGENIEQAENRVANKALGVVYGYQLDLSQARVYEFTDDVLWALFIGVNRNKIKTLNKYPKLRQIIEQIEKYDVIIGKIADDKVANAYAAFLGEQITDICLKECLKLVKYGNQIVFKNNAVVKKCLKEIGHYELSVDMKKHSIQWNTDMKMDMDTKIAEYKIQYRRQGLFLDECLERYR